MLGVNRVAVGPGWHDAVTGIVTHLQLGDLDRIWQSMST